jgi:RNA polymerase sigma factor (sigma-70 family)
MIKLNNTVQHCDQRYINALLTNDTVLLEELYQKYSGKIKRMVLQNNGTETDAADIFQEALLFLYHKAKTQSFVLTCPLDAFLYMICRHKWLNELSKRKSRKVTTNDINKFANIGENSFQLAEQSRLQQQRKELLEEKLSKLSERNKKLLALCWRHKSLEEVAKTMNVTYGYVRKKKSECVKKLANLMKQSPQFSSLNTGS